MLSIKGIWLRNFFLRPSATHVKTNEDNKCLVSFSSDAANANITAVLSGYSCGDISGGRSEENILGDLIFVFFTKGEKSGSSPR